MGRGERTSGAFVGFFPGVRPHVDLHAEAFRNEDVADGTGDFVLSRVRGHVRFQVGELLGRVVASVAFEPSLVGMGKRVAL